MVKPWAIICLGNEPLIFGPFDDRAEAEEWLRSHIDEAEAWEGPYICRNGLQKEDHHVLEFAG